MVWALTPFFFLAKLSQIICCKQSTDQWILVPSKGSVRWAVKAKFAALFFFMAEALAVAFKSSVDTVYPPSSLPLKEVLLHLSPNTQFPARAAPCSTHLPHQHWPGSLASPE